MKIYRTSSLLFVLAFAITGYGMPQQLPRKNYDAPNGTIKSVGFPYGYRDSISQRFLITAPQDMVIAYVVTTFELDYSFDYLKIKDGSLQGYQLRGYHPSLPFYNITTTDKLRLRFVTDNRGNNNRGFSLDYAFVELSTQCDTIPLQDIADYQRRSLSCSHTALNYASYCNISESHIYLRELKCVDGKFVTTSLQLNDSIVALCEENATYCEGIYDYDDIIEYYELSVPEGNYTEEEQEIVEDLDEEDLTLNAGRGVSQNCVKFCRRHATTREYTNPKNCKFLAKKKKQKKHRNCLSCRFGACRIGYLFGR